MENSLELNELNEIKTLYERLIDAWNKRDANGMANLFADKGELIGFDGSIASGSKGIFSHLEPIFKEHQTPPFVSKIKNVRVLNSSAIIVRAIAGMIPPGETEFDPYLNTHQTLLAVKINNNWMIELFQNTPAQFHGRPELVEGMTEELKGEIE